MKDIGEDALLHLISEVYTNAESLRSHDHGLWYIICALRGPDNNDNQLKIKYTGPIRAWVSQDWNNAIGSVTNSKVFTLQEFRNLRDELSNLINCGEYSYGLEDKVENNHYLCHIRLALDVIIAIETNKEKK